MRLLVLLISCLFLNSITQAQQLVARSGRSPPPENEQFDEDYGLPTIYSCDGRRYPLDLYLNQIRKKCRAFNNRIPIFRPRLYKSENFKSILPGPYYKIPLPLKKSLTKVRRQKYRDLAIVTRKCTVVGVVAAVPKKMTVCDRIRRFCVRNFDYINCVPY